jgi:putative transposase
MLKRWYHHVYDVHYHIVFPVKYRRSLLRWEVVESLKILLKWIEERYDIEIEQSGMDDNHIHILCSFPPTRSVWEVVWIIKSITARSLFKQYKDLKEELWWWEFWTDWYYVSTVWQRWNWEVVEKYIKKQWKKPQDVRLRLF